MDTFTLAWRNLWRNQRRTLVTVAATAFALFMTIMYSGLVTGYIRDMEKTVTDLEVGDIQVHASEYRTKPSLYTRIDDADELVRELESAGFGAAPRLLGSGLAALDENSAGVSFRAVDVARDARVSEIHTRVREGEWLDPEAPNEVVIGKRLAHTLGAKVGSELVVLSQAADGSMANDAFVVRGVLHSVSDGVDRGGVYMNLAAFRDLMAVPEGAHQIMVRRPDARPLDEATKQVASMAEGHDVQSWRTLMPTLAQMLDSSQAALMVMFAVVYFAIGIVILNAMLMAVFERVREFGVLKALGTSPGKVLSLILVETAMQTALAIAIGLVLAIPVNTYLSRTGLDLSSMGDVTVVGMAWNPVWKSLVTVETYTTPILTLSVIIFLSVLYPALKAAFIQPVEAMRYR